MRQGTPEWTAAKKAKIGGQAASVIMGVYPWMDDHDLWEQLTGRAPSQEPNAAMRRGMTLEPEGRRAYIDVTGRVVQPQFVTRADVPWAVASLDGITFEGDGIVEIKCPGRAAHEEAVQRNAVPEPYVPQVQHYLWLTGAVWCDFVSYHPDYVPALHIIRVLPDPPYQAALIEKERAWYERHIVRDEEPPRRAKPDVVERTDAVWCEAARIYVEAEAGKAEWEGKREGGRELLLSLMDGAAKVSGGGVTVSRYETQPMDWSGLLKAAQAAGVKTEEFRKPAVVQYRVNVSKT